jgi:hypothetical protein
MKFSTSLFIAISALCLSTAFAAPAGKGLQEKREKAAKQDVAEITNAAQILLDLKGNDLKRPASLTAAYEAKRQKVSDSAPANVAPASQPRSETRATINGKEGEEDHETVPVVPIVIKKKKLAGKTPDEQKRLARARALYQERNLAPSSLIDLPSPSKSGNTGKATVRSVWTVWNKQLRNPDAFHTALITALIEKYGDDGSGIYRDGKDWEQKWFIKYHYYKEIGQEIERRLAKKDGKTVDQIIDRLDKIRESIYNLKTVKALVEGIRNARGEDPINPGRNGKEVDITESLNEEY